MASRLQDVILRGTAALRPLANTVAPGTLYFSTDTGVTERSDGTTWQAYSSAGSGAVALHATTHFSAGTDPVSVLALAGYPGGTTSFLRADATFAVVASGGSGVAFLLSGSGHPQGTQAAAIGSQYIDTTTGYIYSKMGGASTAYGWYLQPVAIGPTAHWVMAADGAGGSPVAIGLNAPSQTNNNSGAAFTDGIYNGSVTSGSIGTRGGWVTGLQNFFGDTGFDAVMRVRTGTTLIDMRLSFGITSADLSNSDDLTGNGFMIRASTGVDTGFVGYTRDGATSSVTASLAAIATSTAYSLRIRFVRTGTPTVYFSVNDGTEIAKTTNIPATGIRYGIAFYVYNKNTTAQLAYYRSMCILSGS